MPLRRAEKRPDHAMAAVFAVDAGGAGGNGGDRVCVSRLCFGNLVEHFVYVGDRLADVRRRRRDLSGWADAGLSCRIRHLRLGVHAVGVLAASDRQQFAAWYKMELGSELTTSHLAHWAYERVLPRIRTPPSEPAQPLYGL